MPRLNSSLRNIFGRRGYFPAVQGFTRFSYYRNDFPSKPPDFPGTEPEWRILLAHGVLGLVEGQHFQYLEDVSNPFRVSGETEVDFLELDVGIDIQIQGTFYHYVGFTGFEVADDLARRVELESLGRTVVYIDGDHAMSDPVFYLRAARQGRDYSRAGRGL